MPKSDKLLPLPEVIDRTALGRATIYRKMRAGTFPRSVHIADRKVAWIEREVMEWIEATIEARA